MNKWTSEQRNHIILLAMATAGIAALIWFGLIGSLQASIQEQMNRIALSRSKLNLTKSGISRKEQFKQEIETGQRQLLDLEGKMPQGDIFRWLNNSMHEIESGHDVNIVDLRRVQDFARALRAGDVRTRTHLAPPAERAAHPNLRPNPNDQRHTYIKQPTGTAETVRIKHSCFNLMLPSQLSLYRWNN